MPLVLDFDKIQEYYKDKFWDKGMVWDAVGKTKITQDQYTKITSDTYPTDRPNTTENTQS